MMVAESAELYGWSTQDLVTEILELRDALQRAEDDLSAHEDCYSADEHADLLQREVESVEDAVRYELRDSLGPIAEDAHSILSDLAWRATTGDRIAAATEAEVADLLCRIRDVA